MSSKAKPSGMFAKAKNAQKLIKRSNTRGVGSNPQELLDDFMDEESFNGFTEDYNNLSDEDKKIFEEYFNDLVQDKELG